MTTTRTLFGAATLMLIATLAGCGSSAEKQDKGFFTSGNKEADQRASQEMAKQQQLTGDTNNGSQGHDASTNAVVAKDKTTLYDELGGADGINAITSDFVDRVIQDPRVNWDRIGVNYGGVSIHHNESMTWQSNPGNVKVLKMHMAQFLALSTGGPVHYDGKQIGQAHQHMHITNAEFDASLGDLKATLDTLKIANQQQKELLSIVESTREQIVEER